MWNLSVRSPKGRKNHTVRRLILKSQTELPIIPADDNTLSSNVTREGAVQLLATVYTKIHQVYIIYNATL